MIIKASTALRNSCPEISGLRKETMEPIYILPRREKAMEYI